ncbi:hypothetical protein SacmaDRAFT_4683 [Saccharomonospora marina XMU15]|uniref:Uncharacterized protein n=1 Tax=Saccharomonospora marina XMU15 TaxID=882083 RepID=H5WXZ0_9PSEU|nr:hypothetical protein SacmaDRAFT_4683 [Saccharomonospora marina XMU15]
MNTAGRLSAYGVALALVAVGGWAIGTAVGPFAGATGAHGAEEAVHGDTHSGTVAESERPNQPGGSTSPRGGYHLPPTGTTFSEGTTAGFSLPATAAPARTAGPTVEGGAR